MTALALIRAPARDRAQRTPSLLYDLGGEPTLDELLVGVWEGLAAQRAIACPVCGAGLTPQYATHPQPIGGRCDDCGSTLS